jgi:hypothetical protein
LRFPGAADLCRDASALDVIFTEHAASEQYGITKPDDVSTRLYHRPGLRPAKAQNASHFSPLLNYKWSRTAAALAALPESAATPCDDLLLAYTNPYTGGPVLPTMGCTAQYLRPGVHTQAHRQASSSVYMVLAGAGWSEIGNLGIVVLSPEGSVESFTNHQIPPTRFGASVLGFQPDGGTVIQIDYRWDGSGGFDFVRFIPAPVWRSSSFDAKGRFTGMIGCLAGWNYRVEASADLKQWETVAAGTSASESVPFSDSAPPGTARSARRFNQR